MGEKKEEGSVDQYRSYLSQEDDKIIDRRQQNQNRIKIGYKNSI